MRIIIGSDHAGFPLKEEVAAFLKREGHTVTDVGTDGETPVDYPDYAWRVARAVAGGAHDRGILVCGTGTGMAIAANKVPGIRAVVALDEETARLARAHNNTNVLALAGRKTGKDEARKIVRTWLETPFEGNRHERRLDKIREMEKSYFFSPEKGPE